MSSTMENDVQILEKFCRELYTTNDASIRNRAEIAVVELSKDQQCLDKCILLFKRKDSAYSQVLAATTLQKLIAGGGTISSQVASQCQQLSFPQKLELRNFVLEYLYENASLERFVSQSIIKLLALLTKYGWLEQDPSQVVTDDKMAKILNKNRDKNEVEGGMEGGNENNNNSQTNNTDTSNSKTTDTANKSKFPYRRIVDEVQAKFFNFNAPNHTINHASVGCQILTAIITEINTGTFVGTSRPLTKQRKVSSSFREHALKSMFILSKNYLEQALIVGVDEKKVPFLTGVFNMAKECLCYDFLGNGLDDCTDDQTVQLPTAWRELVVDGKLFELFMQWYEKGLPDYMNQAVVCCLAQLAAIRRTLFNTQERQDHITRLVKGLLKMVSQPAPLNHPDTYHEFCRYLMRLKTTYQLNELVQCEVYDSWLEACVEFSIRSFNTTTVSPNSLHYLLIFWQKLASSVPYVRSEANHNVDKNAAKVVNAYIESRLRAINSAENTTLNNSLNNSINSNNSVSKETNSAEEGNDPFLDIDRDQREEQLESIAQLARCQYESVGELVFGLLIKMRDVLKVRGGSMSEDEEETVYRQCAWLIQVTASLVGSRVTSLATEKSDEADAELIKTTFEIISVVDNLTSQTKFKVDDNTFQTNAEDLATEDVKGLLQLSILFFFKHFKRIYIGEQMNKTCPVYRMLANSFNLKTETEVLNAIFEKILTNLKTQLACLPVIDASLALLNQLSQGYTTARQMATLENVQNCLQSGLTQLPLISSWKDVPSWVNLGYTKYAAKHRRMLYQIFGRLLMVGFAQGSSSGSNQTNPVTDEYSFYQLVAPLTQEFQELVNALQTNNDSVCKWLAVGLARALRGLTFSLNTKNAFQLLFEWIWQENRIAAIAECAKRYDEPLVIHSILKFYTEFTQNRAQRLCFDVASPNGILLFQNVSQVCIEYGQKLSACNTSLIDDENKKANGGDVYQNLLKGMNLLFRLVHTTLSSSFVNFGMFRLYNDSSLDKVLQMFLDLTVSKLGDCSNLLAYPKCAETFYQLVEQLSEDHVEWFCNLNEESLVRFMLALKSGITAVNSVQTRSCGTLDNLVTLVYKQLKRKEVLDRQTQEVKARLMLPTPTLSNFVQLLSKQPSILQEMLAIALYHVLFEECKNQWSISRPLLPLILFNKDYFEQLKNQVLSQNIRTAPDMAVAEKIQRDVEACFKKLMTDIEDNLDVRNRDKFTHSLTIFRREMTEAIRGNDEIWNTSAPTTIPANYINLFRGMPGLMPAMNFINPLGLEMVGSGHSRVSFAPAGSAPGGVIAQIVTNDQNMN